MATSYTSWEKYDVDKAMKQLEEDEVRERKEKEKEKIIKKKKLVVQDAGDSAEILATKAALAALKAKKLAERKKEKAKDDSQMNALNQQAKILQLKSTSIQNAMRSRSKGEQFLAKSQFTQAIASFESGIEAVKQLNSIIPQLETIRLEHEEKKTIDDPSCMECQQDCNHNNQGTSTCCGHSNDKTPTQPPQPSIPKSTDLVGISKMLHVDCLVGIGKCKMELCHYAAASEAFKEAILQDGENLDAWKYRAEAFHSMGAPLISMLHLNKVVLMEGENGDSKRQLDTLEGELIVEPVDEEETYKTAMKYLTRPSVRETLVRIKLLRDEADIMMIEGFYVYSSNKYRAILDILTSLSLPTGALHELRLACHVNIASGYIEMKKHYSRALEHCLSALALDPANGAVQYRIGHVYRKLFKFTLAREHLTKASALFPSDAKEQHAKIRQELESVEFDASEMDVNYNLKELS